MKQLIVLAMLALVSGLSASCGDENDACDDLRSICESCTESVSRSVCLSFVEADDTNACEAVQQNGLQPCGSLDAGIDTGF